ncbi:MAG: EF-P lysine aminoacylase GenX [Wenzhouxiangella sp.]|nr:EF-P lysine aminoacylase GenX [Wenzhouxiangella sp.]MCH8478072.1 EF-P lysine aminoacylase GenX [Wenzhouxiangella sp.]TVR94795.1 MAG: EF-P lysine aminoacylase GenX [Wenzhouxiangellaceae bacterium]
MTSWRPGADRRTLQQRAQLLSAIRDFFAERQVLEVQTPLLTPAGVSDPHIESLQVTGLDGYLRTSPEYFHKRLLAAQLGDLYEMGPVFRGSEQGRLHRTEFLLLEWYRCGWTWQRLAKEVCELILHCAASIGADGYLIQWRAWTDCFTELGVEPLTASETELRALVPELVGTADCDSLLDYLFASHIQPRLPAKALSIVYHYPASQAALARLDPEQPELAQRFEVFVGPIELANGYQELTCPTEQRLRFERDNRRRDTLGLPAMPMDEALLQALTEGLPDCAGVALGVDRLLMALLGLDRIDLGCAF